MSATLYALAAIALWGTLASLGTSLSHLPPFLLTGLALMIGSVLSWPPCCATASLGGAGAHAGARHLRPVRLPLPAVHRAAPCAAGRGQPGQLPVAAASWWCWRRLLLPGVWLRPLHVVAALLGFAGAAIAILGGARRRRRGSGTWGFCRRWAPPSSGPAIRCGPGACRAFPTSAIGLFGLVSGVLVARCATRCWSRRRRCRHATGC